MSKQYEYSTSRYDLKSPGPADAAEFDAQAKSDGACVAEAVASVTYRSTIPEFWDAFIPKVEELTGIKRGIDDKATARNQERAKEGVTVKPVPEKFLSYDNRVWAASDEARRAELIALAQATAAEIAIDPAPSRRSSGPGALFIAKAESVLGRPEDQLQATVTKLLDACPGFELETDENGKPEKNSLAKLIKAYADV